MSARSTHQERLSRISRRGFLGSGVAASMLAASGVAAVAAPRQGAGLRLALSDWQPGSSFDMLAEGGRSRAVLGQGAIFDCLTMVTAEGALRGELARDWMSDPEARIWVITLRPNVTFHDGGAFTARDVVASLGRDPALLPGVTQIRAVSDRAVEFRLARPDPGFPFALADPALVIYQARDLAASMQGGIGTGLYALVEQRADHAVLRRVSDHYKARHGGYFEGLRVYAMPSAQDRRQALREGAVDAIEAVAPEHVRTVSATPRHDLLHQPGGRVLEVAARPGHEGLLAGIDTYLDRDALCRDVFHGFAHAAEHRAMAATSGASGAVAIGFARDLPGQPALAVLLRGALAACGSRAVVTAPERADLVLRFREAAPTPDLGRAGAVRNDLLALAQADLLDAHSTRLVRPPQIGRLGPLDSHRIAERWWFAG